MKNLKLDTVIFTLPNFDELVKRQLLSFRAKSRNSVTAWFVLSFDYAQDDIFRFEMIFYETIIFKSLKKIDDKLELFNQSSQRYTGNKRPEKNPLNRNFTPKVYFIRQVKEISENNKFEAYINILNVIIQMPKSLVNYYVLSKWKLNKETLNIFFEKDKRQKLIKKIDFKINKNQRKNLMYYKIAATHFYYEYNLYTLK